MQAIKGNQTGTIKDARDLERKGEIKAAAELYVKLHQLSPKNLNVVQRLIIIYRKLKDEKKEIRYIDMAIKIHEAFYAAPKKADKQIISLSKKLNILLGHTDKKGRSLFRSDDVLKLQLRKNRLQSKMEASATKKK